MSNSQFGFSAGRSCVTQLLATLKDCMQNLDENKPTDVVYLDLQKAFDTVPHNRLITKLQGYGIKGDLCNWIQDFLSEREQFVSVGNQSSGYSKVTSGVPQGSVLGPTLFIYYINDMPDILDCLVKIFADDTKIYSQVCDIEDRTKLQENLNKLTSWTRDWQIQFNNKKCKVLHVGKIIQSTNILWRKYY